MGSQDKREHKGQLTPGDSEMELRDPENHEDGDTEVRDGTQGRKKARERERQCRDRVRDGGEVGPEADAEGQKETLKTQGTIKPSEISETQNNVNLRTHRKTKVPEKWAQKQRTGSTGREEDGERDG